MTIEYYHFLIKETLKRGPSDNGFIITEPFEINKDNYYWFNLLTIQDNQILKDFCKKCDIDKLLACYDENAPAPSFTFDSLDVSLFFKLQT